MRTGKSEGMGQAARCGGHQKKTSGGVAPIHLRKCATAESRCTPGCDRPLPTGSDLLIGDRRDYTAHPPPCQSSFGHLGQNVARTQPIVFYDLINARVW